MKNLNRERFVIIAKFNIDLKCGKYNSNISENIFPYEKG